MRRYKTRFKKFSDQGKNLVTGGQRLYALPNLCMKVRHEFSLLHRACCFDYFFNIPAHAHALYTL